MRVPRPGSPDAGLASRMDPGSLRLTSPSPTWHDREGREPYGREYWMAVAAEASHDLELRHSSIGLADVLFQAITYMAPGVGLAFSIGIAVPISGATLPLSVVVALAACTFCAVAIG